MYDVMKDGRNVTIAKEVSGYAKAFHHFLKRGIKKRAAHQYSTSHSHFFPIGYSVSALNITVPFTNGILFSIFSSHYQCS